MKRTPVRRRAVRRKAREFWVVVNSGEQALYVHWREYRKAQVMRWANQEWPSAEGLEAVHVREVLPRRRAKR